MEYCMYDILSEMNTSTETMPIVAGCRHCSRAWLNIQDCKVRFARNFPSLYRNLSAFVVAI